MNCAKCGGQTTAKRHSHVEQVGRFTVTDNSAQGTARVCDTCGEWTLTLEQLAGYERRAARTVMYERNDAGGAELRYARKALGLRQVDLGKLLGHNPVTMSRWETSSSPIPDDLRLAVAGLLAGVESGDVTVASLLAAAQSPEPPTPEIRLEVHRPPRKVAVG